MALSIGGVSLETAIRDKYCSREGDGEGQEGVLPARKQIKESAIYLRPGVPQPDSAGVGHAQQQSL